ncbi:MAG: oxalate/formate MFS antiporter [Alphaproteobacteria bacterium]
MSIARRLASPAPPGRNWQLFLGVVAMMAISSPQYVWTLFVAPMQADLGISLSALQVTIAIFSICMCGLGPIHGYLAARSKPSVFVAAGGVLLGASWISASFAHTSLMMYLAYGVLSGLGVGIVFVAVTDLMNKWFPDRRGFAVGMVAGSYGFGAILTTFPIAAVIKGQGFRQALLVYGLVLGVVCIASALGMKRPPQELLLEPEDGAGKGEAPDYRPAQMLATPAFWLLFLMMTMVGTGGLMVISQMAVFAKGFGIGPATTVFGMAALPLALTIDRVANGATRPFFGWVSDRIGRENTMAIAFSLEAASILLLLVVGSNPILFVILSGVVFFGWGEIFSLFPSAQADIFGTRYSAQNFGFLLASIAVSSILGGPLAALMFEKTGSWPIVFASVAGLDFLSAVLALFVLKPLGARLRVARAA